MPSLMIVPLKFAVLPPVWLVAGIDALSGFGSGNAE